MSLFCKDKMTEAERTMALMKGEPLDRIPYAVMGFAFMGINAGYSIFEYYEDMKKSFESQVHTNEQYGSMPMAFAGYPAIGPWELGGEFKWPTTEFAQCPSTEPAVKTEEEAWNLKVPPIEELKTLGYMPRFLEFGKLANDAGYPFTPTMYGPWTTAGNIVGIDKLCKWMLKKPDLAHHVIRIATDFLVAVNKMFVDAFGTQLLVGGVSTASADNNIISPKSFQEFVAPYLKELYQKLLAMGFPRLLVHICGEQNANYPYYKSVPLGTHGIVSVSHEVDLEYAMKFYPDDIILGNIEPALFQTGTPEEVYEKCRMAIEKGKKHKGGFVLGPGCEMPPFSRPYNVWTMTKAVNDFGYYD
jgi:uroporphyrinogen decarboxylase